ncbi:kinase-like protein [Gigaspora margarita]|uniref:Kinase-like protein n=2 Tax=Gigaspora margarita TaxID=4874 RepID=A0A8H4AAI7_GIGMA|nr:kinase-like protein [Gigaspora margarita]
MSDTSAYVNHVANVTSSALGVAKIFSTSSAVVADVIVPFVPLISEIASIVNEIITLYQTAEHNKRICGSLLSRATAAQTAVNNLEIRRAENEDLFKSKEYYKNFQKLVNVIVKIKIFIEDVSQIKGLRRFLASKSIEDEFKTLTEDFDGLMRVLNFTMAVQNQIQMDEDRKVLKHDISEMTKYLREIEGGITNITDNMTQINSKLDDITQLNLAWQKKLLNNDENIFESALIKMTDLYDPPESVKRGKISKKSLNYDDVAVKEKFLESNDQDLIKDILSQVVILKKLKESQYILQFFGIVQDGNVMYMVTEWCEYGNLQDFYRGYGPLNWFQKSSIAVDIVRGLTFLHTVSILHHDIRSENILITIHQQAKIANFTLSRGFNDPTKNVLPTIEMVRWMAPEKLSDHEKNPYTIKCEIYSFGMLLWEIAEEKIPFENERDILEIRNLILIKKVRPSFSIGVPIEYSKISYQSMQDSPNARPALKNIFLTLYSLYQKNQPKSSPRPIMRMPTDDDLPDVDPNELSLDDLTLNLNVLSMKEAIAEHRKKNCDKLKVWDSFKVHAEEFGDITARYWVGYYLYYGLCPIDNPNDENKKIQRLEKAAALFKEAADSGLADAQLRYGHCLWLGEGIQKNIKEAIEYFQKSADNGNTTALYNIGNLYYNGTGVPQDKELGIRYLRKAALQGQPKALEMCKKKEIGLVG